MNFKESKVTSHQSDSSATDTPGRIPDWQVQEEKISLEMMRRPHLWPMLILPLKHQFEKDPNHKPWPRMGLLFARARFGGGEKEYYFYKDKTLGMKAVELGDPERGYDEMLVRLDAEGWIVD